jgi:hypothetical protein
MSQTLTLELSDDVYAILKQQADEAGMPVNEWILTYLVQYSESNNHLESKTSAEQQEVRQRFRRHAGSISLGYATGTNNEQIDADLARAYTHDSDEADS